MSAKILHATRDARGFHFLVHLDPEMTVGTYEAHELALPAGSPHPHFVRRWDFANLTPGVHQRHDPAAIAEDNPRGLVDMTEPEYLESVEAMLKEQVALELQGIRFYPPASPAHTLIDSLHGKEI